MGDCLTDYSVAGAEIGRRIGIVTIPESMGEYGEHQMKSLIEELYRTTEQENRYQ